MTSAYQATDALLTARAEGGEVDGGVVDGGRPRTAEGADGGGIVTLSGK